MKKLSPHPQGDPSIVGESDILTESIILRAHAGMWNQVYFSCVSFFIIRRQPLKCSGLCHSHSDVCSTPEARV